VNPHLDYSDFAWEEERESLLEQLADLRQEEVDAEMMAL